MFVVCVDFGRTVSVHHVLPTDLHVFFEKVEIKNIFDILSSFSNFVNINITSKVGLEPFEFRLAATRPRFRVLQKWINSGFVGCRTQALCDTARPAD
jgi:hypothetical protein